MLDQQNSLAEGNLGVNRLHVTFPNTPDEDRNALLTDSAREIDGTVLASRFHRQG